MDPIVEKEKINYKARDAELFHAWKSTGSKKDLGILLQQVSPLIYKEVHRASGSLPTSALHAEATSWALKAIRSYDPDKGTALSTHVTNYLQKVRRMNYTYQNMVRLPEDKTLQYGNYAAATAKLQEIHDREPNEEELAKELGWSKPQVIKFKNSLYKDLPESGYDRASEYTQYNNQTVFLEHLRQQLSTEELFIMDNVGKMPSAELAQKLNIDVNRLNYLKSKLKDRILAYKTQLGI